MSNHNETDSHQHAPDPSIEEADRLEPPEQEDEGLNWRLVVGVVVSAAVIGLLVVDGLGSETYFFTVNEAVSQSTSLAGQTIRVKGKVVDGSIEGDKGGVGRTFSISEKGETIRISYDKAMPDTFKEDVQVVATGEIDASGTLKADEILVKCPSRYEGKPPTAHEGKMGPQSSR